MQFVTAHIVSSSVPYYTEIITVNEIILINMNKLFHTTATNYKVTKS